MTALFFDKRNPIRSELKRNVLFTIQSANSATARLLTELSRTQIYKHISPGLAGKQCKIQLPHRGSFLCIKVRDNKTLTLIIKCECKSFFPSPLFLKNIIFFKLVDFSLTLQFHHRCVGNTTSTQVLCFRSPSAVLNRVLTCMGSIKQCSQCEMVGHC